MRPLISNTATCMPAVPPLHRIALTGSHKGEYIYTYSDDELAGNWPTSTRSTSVTTTTFQRYKGLGEMDADQLADTTMDPRTRMLRRIRMEDAAQAFRESSSLLIGRTTCRRASQFIVDNADRFRPLQDRYLIEDVGC